MVVIIADKNGNTYTYSEALGIKLSTDNTLLDVYSDGETTTYTVDGLASWSEKEETLRES